MSVCGIVPFCGPPLDDTPMKGNWLLHRGDRFYPMYGENLDAATQAITFSEGQLDFEKYQWYNSPYGPGTTGPILEIGFLAYELPDGSSDIYIKFRGNMLFTDTEYGGPVYKYWSGGSGEGWSYDFPAPVKLANVASNRCFDIDAIDLGTLCAHSDKDCVTIDKDGALSNIKTMILQREEFCAGGRWIGTGSDGVVDSDGCPIVEPEPKLPEPGICDEKPTVSGRWLLNRSNTGINIFGTTTSDPFLTFTEERTGSAGYVWYVSDKSDPGGTPILELGVLEESDDTGRNIYLKFRGRMFWKDNLPENANLNDYEDFWSSLSSNITGTYQEPSAIKIATFPEGDDTCFVLDSIDLGRICNNNGNCVTRDGGGVYTMILQREELCGDDLWTGNGEDNSGALDPVKCPEPEPEPYVYDETSAIMHYIYPEEWDGVSTFVETHEECIDYCHDDPACNAVVTMDGVDGTRCYLGLTLINPISPGVYPGFTTYSFVDPEPEPEPVASDVCLSTTQEMVLHFVIDAWTTSDTPGLQFTPYAYRDETGPGVRLIESNAVWEILMVSEIDGVRIEISENLAGVSSWDTVKLPGLALTGEFYGDMYTSPSDVLLCLPEGTTKIDFDYGGALTFA